MTADRLNFYQPYHRLPSDHENTLTRALLLVLKHSPLAHEAWLKRVVADQARRPSIYELPVATFRTQTADALGDVLEGTGDGLDSDSPPRVLSVFLSLGMEAQPGEVEASDRSQVLDAVIQYGSEMIVVVETKRWEEDDLQSLSLNFGDATDQLEIVEKSIPLSWGDVVADFSALVERDLLGGAERAIVSEFVDFVEDVHPQLGSFRKLGECGESSYRINRRIKVLLRSATDEAPREDKYGPLIDLPSLGGVAQHLYLWRAGDGAESFLEMSVFPADTLSQARSFYSAPHAVSFVKSLVGRLEWNVRPNFHFGHMQTGMVWTHTSMEVNNYIDYWVDLIGSAHAVSRAEWDAYLTELETSGLLTNPTRPNSRRGLTGLPEDLRLLDRDCP